MVRADRYEVPIWLMLAISAGRVSAGPFDAASPPSIAALRNHS